MSTPLRRSARKVPKAKLAMDRSPSPASNKPAAKKPPARKVSTKKAASAKKAALSTDGNWGGADLGASAGMFGGRETWGPIFLMVTTPILIFFFWCVLPLLARRAAAAARLAAPPPLLPSLSLSLFLRS